VKALRTFHSWMFSYGSPMTMGVFRAVMGGLVFINLCMVAIDFNSWFTETGYIPTAMLDRWNGPDPYFGTTPRLNLLENVTNPSVTMVFYALTTLAALLTTLGLWTRVASIALLIGVTTLHHRAPDILHSGDTLMRAMLVYIAVAPSGAAFSLDRLFALRKGNAPADLPEVSLWPQRMMQVQVAIVYLTTMWHKSFGEWWLNGTATWFPPQLDEFDRFPVPAFFDQQPMIAITTYGTLLVELALGTLVFAKPLRKWVLLGGVILHAGIEWRMNIPLFAFTAVACYMTFYEGEEVTAWMKRVRDRLRGWAGRRRELAQAAKEATHPQT
jgi:hypothetical protein